MNALIDAGLAERLDNGATGIAELHPRLAAEGIYRRGVPAALGGDDAPMLEAVQAIAGLSATSLAAGFAVWCQRSCIHYLVHAGRPIDDGGVLPRLLDGSLAGATGLSNAMKHLAGFEPLRLRARPEGETIRLDGNLPWITNLVPERFVVALAGSDGDRTSVVLVPSSAAGVRRLPDLPLSGLRGTATAPLELGGVRVGRPWVLGDDGVGFLTRVKPGFLLLQCGLMLGLAGRSLDEIDRAPPISQRILGTSAARLRRRLRFAWKTVALLAKDRQPDQARVRRLVQIRVALVRIASEAVRLEAEALGGAGFMANSGTARRVREAAFLPALTPTVIQLEDQLAAGRGRNRRLPACA